MQVWCMTQGTQSWCSVTTWRDRVGRKMGGGVQDGGDTQILMANSYWCMTKPSQYCNYPLIKKIRKGLWAWSFLCGKLITNLNPLTVVTLFRFFVSFGKLYFFMNLSISAKLLFVFDFHCLFWFSANFLRGVPS